MGLSQGTRPGAHGRKFEKLAFEGEAVFRPQPLHHRDAFHRIVPTALETAACKLDLQSAGPSRSKAKRKATATVPVNCGDLLGDNYRMLHRHDRSEEHTSELQSLMRISYAVFCLKKKNNNISDI